MKAVGRVPIQVVNGRHRADSRQGSATPEPERSDAAGRDAYYDGIRAVAIGTVVCVHFVAPHTTLLQGGYIGVDVFFVVSGFIITTILWRRNPSASTGRAYGIFLKNRVRRLYPALLAMLAGGVLLSWLTDGLAAARQSAWSAFLAATQATSVRPGLGWTALGPFTHTWSLSVEWSFYLLWPLVVIIARRRGLTADWLATGAAAAAVLLYAVSLPSTERWFYSSSVSRAPELLAGGALSLWLLSGRRRPRLGAAATNVLITAALLAIAGWTIFGTGYLVPAYRWVGFPMTALAAIALCAAPAVATTTSTAARLLSARPMAVLGLVSYSLYLWHLTLFLLIDKDFLPWSRPEIAAVELACTALMTAISYRYLERPFMHSRRSSLRIQGPADSPQPAVISVAEPQGQPR